MKNQNQSIVRESIISLFSRPIRGRVLLSGAMLFFILSAASPPTRADCRQGCDNTYENTYLGEQALINNIGADNTAVGYFAGHRRKAAGTLDRAAAPFQFLAHDAKK